MKNIVTSTNIRPATLNDLLREAERRHLLIPCLNDTAISSISNSDLLNAIEEYTEPHFNFNIRRTEI